VVDDHTLAFADLEGNRQFITLGNLADNDRAFLFFMDYAHRRRVKVWGRARVVEHPERMIVFTVEAWDVNCPKHIPQKLDAAVVAAAIAERDRRIAELERENRELRARLQCV
jgi:predicted pyridoxine 5'-phosphate oxidase superfamily flavin-nucleotide-binding protein